ncbi:MAG: hypothetical protein D6B27_06320 [Gammaproteobacteria bacterium]|nr:MAG: hypothetical protein D6B27_06320 [Gammaproteobacteria bacterium]
MAARSKKSIRVRLIFFISLVTAFGFASFLAVSFIISTQNFERLDKIKNVYFPIFEMSESNAAKLERIAENLATAASTGEMDFIIKAREQAYELSQSIGRLKKIEPDRKRLVEIDRFSESFQVYFNQASKYSQQIASGNVNVASDPEGIIKISDSLQHCRKMLNIFRSYSLKNFQITIENANRSSAIELRLGLIMALVTVILISTGSVVITSGIDVKEQE